MRELLVIGAVCAIVVVAALAKGAHGGWRDPRRSFSAAERAVIFSRAGGRCEHRGLFLRCRRPAAHADHVWPWSAGGPTTIANGEALCARHNLSKGARRPTRWYMARLERGRRNYFLPGQSTHVATRHRGWQ